MRWGGRWEGVLRWGTHVNPWLIDINVWPKKNKKEGYIPWDI